MTIWRRFRGLPIVAQVVVWVVVGFLGIGAVGAATGAGQTKTSVKTASAKTSTSTSSATTTTLPGGAVFTPDTVPAVPAGVPMPNPALTPGAVATTDLTLLCQSGYTQTVRDVSETTKKAVFREYGIDPALSSQYEVDHLVSLEVGGSNDIRNLWPEPYAGDWGARTKDRLENRLHFDICRGAMSVADAQHGEATNWYAQYQRLLGASTTTAAPATVAPVTAAPATTPATSPAPTQPPGPSDEGQKQAGQFCSPPGATAHAKDGRSLSCSEVDANGHYHWAYS